MSSVTWPLESQMVLSYWWSVDAKSLSHTFAEILSLKHFGVMTLTHLDPFRSRNVIGHVTIGTTVDRLLLVIHWHHNVPTRTITEILSVKNNWVTSLTPRCHVTLLVTLLEPHMVIYYRCSVDAKSLSHTVAKILSLKHFGVTTLRGVIDHVTIGTADGRFLLVIHWHHVPIYLARLLRY